MIEISICTNRDSEVRAREVLEAYALHTQIIYKAATRQNNSKVLYFTVSAILSPCYIHEPLLQTKNQLQVEVDFLDERAEMLDAQDHLIIRNPLSIEPMKIFEYSNK